MTKTTLFLIVLLAIAIVILLLVNKPVVRQFIKPQKTLPLQSTPKPVSLFLRPINSTKNTTITLGLQIEPIQNLSQVQIEIGYNPLLMQLDNITAGDIFLKPTISLKSINNHTGRVSFALQCDAINKKSPCKQTSKNMLALLTFTQIAPITNKNNEVTILPKTNIVSPNMDLIPYKAMNYLLVKNKTIAPEASRSASR